MSEHRLCSVIDLSTLSNAAPVFHRWVDTYGYPHMELHKGSPEQVARTYGNCWTKVGSEWVRLY